MENPKAERQQLINAFAKGRIDMEEIEYRRVENGTFEKINSVCSLLAYMALRHNRNSNSNRTLLQEIKIVQHNVRHWSRPRSIRLGNYYRKENTDVILLNSTGITDNDKIRIYNYNVTSRNILNEMHAGVAVAVRKDLQHRIIDDFTDDVLGVQIETTKGPLMFITHYSPPRRNYIPTAELENKLQKNIPVYFAGDLSAHLSAMGYDAYNHNGREIQRLIQQNKIINLGPDFRTLVHKNGKPDIVFTNRTALLNYAVKRGNLTSSDHFPVMLRVSTRPIVKRTERTRCLCRTNWEDFKRKMETRMEHTFKLAEIETRTDIDAGKIEEYYGHWYKAIEESLEETSPKTKVSFYLHARDSDFLKLLEITYRDLTTKPFWTREDIKLLKTYNKG